MAGKGYLVRLFVQTHFGSITVSGDKGCPLSGGAEGDTCTRAIHGLLLCLLFPIAFSSK